MAKNWLNFETIRDELNFTAVLNHYGFTFPAGKPQVTVHCPFHDDGKPSCGVNLDKKLFNCWSCKASGNILDFVTMMEGLDPNNNQDLRAGAKFVCETFDIDGRSDKSPDDETSRPKAKNRKNSKAAKKAAQKPQAKKAAEPQGTTENASEAENSAPVGEINPPLTFTLDLKASHPFLRERGFKPTVLKKFGVGFYEGKGMMNGRICFPIHNAEGELVAYSGRWASDELPPETPRYKLPKGFQKSLVLYNLHRLKSAPEPYSTQHVVLVEGFWSVMRLHERSVPVVSTMGDSISQEHIQLLTASGITHVTVLYDGDEGGRSGTELAVEVLSRNMFVRAIDLEDGIKPEDRKSVV